MSNDNIRLTIQVAPFAGAWIEIVCSNVVFIMPQVAPFAGAWIEIRETFNIQPSRFRRSLRGSVD